MIEKLKKILKQDDTVLFIGSGVSLWSALPSWRGLIQELIDFIRENGLDADLVEQEMKKGDLLQSASYGFDKLTKQQFAEFIRKASRLETAQPQEIHRKIIELGPTCFITTNYDRLLELSFQKWKSNTYFRTVNNTQLTETAEIVGARNSHFLFKLHGDAENSDSIVLTREQYRALNPGGERNHAFETARTLMLSRPIVYIGFGLRDPDFLYLRDLIFNTYKGGARDHYAIMADVSDAEKDYWRKHFSIHLISYQTVRNSAGALDHSNILGLLDRLIAPDIDVTPSTLTLDSEFILNLNRHAAKYCNFRTSHIHLPLVVHPIEYNKKQQFNYRYYGATIEKLLDEGPDKFVLIGLPGGGKSYSLKGSVKRLSEILSKACIEDTVKFNETVIPIYVDLKLYEGNLIDLIEQNIPSRIDLSILCSNFKVKLYIDAFNEIPREYIESKTWSSDISALLDRYNLSVVISSRTIEGLEELGLPGFNLDSIEREYIISCLSQNQLELKGVFKDEIITLLQKPFFYKLIFENKFKIQSETSPQQIYFNLIQLVNKRLNERFTINVNLQDLLSRVAMDAIDSGEEAFKIEMLSRYINLELKNIKDVDISSHDIINWLVSQDFIVPLVNERISFFHQSVTEYLAATRLALLYIEDNQILRKKLNYRRWDQALFLCLSLLKKEEANKFLETIIQIDFELALSATKYLEEDRSDVVSRLLTEINSATNKDFNWESQIAFRLGSSVPMDESHIPILKQIIKKGNLLGGAAANCILDLQGESYKDEALLLLVEYCDDFNLCSAIGEDIKRYVTEDDILFLLTLCEIVQKKHSIRNITDSEGFEVAMGNILGRFTPQEVFTTFYDKAIVPQKQHVQLEVLLNYLSKHRNYDSLEVAIELLMLGIDKVVTSIHFTLRFSSNINYSTFQPEHINALIEIVGNRNGNHSEWGLNCLFSVISNRDDLKHIVEERIENNSGLIRVALYYSISTSGDYTSVYNALESLLQYDSKTLQKENFQLLSMMYNLNWIGQEELLIKLLKLKIEKLAYGLCNGLTLYSKAEKNLVLNIGTIYWWLDWLIELLKLRNMELITIDRISRTITMYIPETKRKEFISEFNNPHSEYRNVISQVILSNMRELKIDDFTEEALMFLFEELKVKEVGIFYLSPLVGIATEKFVTERMLPLLESSEGIQHRNLIMIIEEIGRRHKRRYLI